VNDDIKALERARDALWDDPDEEDRPSVEYVGGQVVRIMAGHNLPFTDACALLIARHQANKPRSRH
jgi:hypothetical protein